MDRVFKVFKCEKCGTVIMQMENNEDIVCCENSMIELIPNSVDASFEKHVPTYEKIGDKIVVKVNHVMEEEHYIEWIAHVTKDNEQIHYFEPYMIAETEFNYTEGATLYAYCNKHGLWKKEVE